MPEQASRPDVHALAARALDLYPGAFEGCTLVKHRENAVFDVRRDDGARMALRLHRQGYHSDRALRSEIQWIQALDGAGMPVPEVIRTAAGTTLTNIEDPHHGAWQVDMFTWIDGQPLSLLEKEGGLDKDAHARLYGDLGRLAARMHGLAQLWSPPADFVRHDWFVDALLGDEPIWGRFWDLDALSAAQQQLFQEARRRAASDLRQFGISTNNACLIHADMIPDNIIVQDGRLWLIDFDDAGFGWCQFELATILYHKLGSAEFGSLRDALFEGYRSVCLLSPTAEDLLPLFLLARGMTYLGWMHTRRETATARELTSSVIETCCRLAEAYLT